MVFKQVKSGSIHTDGSGDNQQSNKPGQVCLHGGSGIAFIHSICRDKSGSRSSRTGEFKYFVTWSGKREDGVGIDIRREGVRFSMVI